ncbi:RAB23 [Symbiodinium natans]|uniref:RAB23 protein n=1 Tax=Symbiodinium natans TaxID=878477 RepID=A0A812KFN3_9DINO|nr:RAB23 [Symbiodinium natans]
MELPPAAWSPKHSLPLLSQGAGYISLSEEQKAREMSKLQHMIRDFVMEFLQGVFLDAVLEDGSLVPCRCVMDSKLSILMLQVHATTRTVDLTSIQEICSGGELKDLQVTTPLDEHCVTLVMADDQCVSFKHAPQDCGSIRVQG